MYTTYPMLTEVANPLGKPHKTKNKREIVGAIATPLRKPKTTKQKKVFTLIRE